MQELTTPKLADPARLQFDSWSEVYDEQPNPMLSLERRTLEPLIPLNPDRAVLDIGCGTGRWLSLLESGAPKRVVGLDVSCGMLDKAKRRAGSAHFVLSDCSCIPFLDQTFDLAVASFVFSYVDDSKTAFSEIWRVLSPGGELLLSDLHPDTSSRFGWRRGFSTRDTDVSLYGFRRSIPDIRSGLEEIGFKVLRQLEPLFGEDEQIILEHAGKADVFHQCAGHPPIYIMQVRKPLPVSRVRARHDVSQKTMVLSHSEISVSAVESRPADVVVCGGRIRSMGIRTARPQWELDLEDYLLLPGLINAHDHLEFGLFPRLGRGPYASASEWAADIHDQFADEIARQRKVSRSTRLWWGAIRNLLAGVTTVCHHNTYEAEFQDPDFPVRVVRDYRWGHSLQFETDLPGKLQAGSTEAPFVIHLGEGTTAACRSELSQLAALGGLSASTVIVHGLAFDENDASLLNFRGAALVWCPSSADFLFAQSQNPELIRSIHRVALGTDSPLTACGDLLDEMKFAHAHGHSASELYRHVTLFASDVLRLTLDQGSITTGGMADFIAIAQTEESPAKALLAASFRDVEMVMLGGKIRLLSDQLRHRFPEELVKDMELLDVAGVRRWIAAPIDRLLNDAHQVLGSELALAGKKVTHAGQC